MRGDINAMGFSVFMVCQPDILPARKKAERAESVGLEMPCHTLFTPQTAQHLVSVLCVSDVLDTLVKVSKT